MTVVTFLPCMRPREHYATSSSICFYIIVKKTLSLVRHPNIESFYAYALSDNVRCCYYLVSEFTEKGSLDSFWEADVGPERLSLFRRRIQIALDVMTAIQFLHIGNDQLPSSLHGDINSASIVLKRHFTAQLID